MCILYISKYLGVSIQPTYQARKPINQSIFLSVNVRLPYPVDLSTCLSFKSEFHAKPKLFYSSLLTTKELERLKSPNSWFHSGTLSVKTASLPNGALKWIDAPLDQGFCRDFCGTEFTSTALHPLRIISIRFRGRSVHSTHGIWKQRWVRHLRKHCP